MNKGDFMYASLKELYIMLLPAFNVKRRLLSVSKNVEINNIDIWNYLANNKWRKCSDLTISEIVNDIIDFDVNLLKKDGV